MEGSSSEFDWIDIQAFTSERSRATSLHSDTKHRKKGQEDKLERRRPPAGAPDNEHWHHTCHRTHPQDSAARQGQAGRNTLSSYRPFQAENRQSHSPPTPQGISAAQPRPFYQLIADAERHLASRPLRLLSPDRKRGALPDSPANRSRPAQPDVAARVYADRNALRGLNLSPASASVPSGASKHQNRAQLESAAVAQPDLLLRDTHPLSQPTDVSKRKGRDAAFVRSDDSWRKFVEKQARGGGKLTLPSSPGLRHQSASERHHPPANEGDRQLTLATPFKRARGSPAEPQRLEGTAERRSCGNHLVPGEPKKHSPQMEALEMLAQRFKCPPALQAQRSPVARTELAPSPGRRRWLGDQPALLPGSPPDGGAGGGIKWQPVGKKMRAAPPGDSPPGASGRIGALPGVGRRWAGASGAADEEECAASRPSLQLFNPALVGGCDAREDWNTTPSRFTHLASTHLMREMLEGLRGGTSKQVHTSEVTMMALKTEHRRLSLAREHTMRQLQELTREYVLQEASEKRILHLISELERLRATPNPLAEKLVEVVEVVQDINNIRGRHSQGSASYVSKHFGIRCSNLPLSNFANGIHGWGGKMDSTGRKVGLREAFAFGGGNGASGEVVIQLSVGSYKGRNVRLKEACTLDPASYRQLYLDYNTVLISELLPEMHSAETEDKRAEAMASIELLITELHCLEHIFYINNPEHYRRPENWMADTSPIISNDKRDETCKIALHAMEASDEQLRTLWSIWTRRAHDLAPLKLKVSALRSQAASAVEEFSASRQTSPETYTRLLDQVGQLKDSLDEMAVTNSVAISASLFSALTPFQVGIAMATAYPQIIDIRHVYEKKLMPKPSYMASDSIIGPILPE